MRRLCSTRGFGRNHAIALLLAVGFCATNLAGLYHYATVSHTRCAEHGENVHGAQAPRHVTVTDAWFAAGSGAADDHDHCGIDPWTRDRLSTWEVAAVKKAPLAGYALTVARACELGRGACVYQIAPKTSPPLA